MVQYEPNSRSSCASGQKPESAVVPMQMGSGAQKTRARPCTLMGLYPDGHEPETAVTAAVALVAAGVGVGATVGVSVGATVGAVVGVSAGIGVGADVVPLALQPYTPEDTRVQ
jgi:hypothetical protein